MTGANTLLKDLYYARIQADFVTADSVTTFRQSQYSPDNSSVLVGNTILANVGGLNSGDFTNNCASHPWVANRTIIYPVFATPITGSTAGYFTTNGAGMHYLASPPPTNSAGLWLGTGCDSIQDFLATNEPAASLLVTWPPASLTLPSGVGIVEPQLHNSGTEPGYHYWRMDHLADNVTVSGTLSLTNGVIIGMTGTKAFQLNAGASFASGGSPTTANRLVRVSLVQEGTNGLTGSSFSVFGLGTGSPRPTIDARFTDILLPGGPGRTLVYDIGNALAALTLRDCRVVNGSVYLLPPATSVSQTVSLVNNIFERMDLGFHHYYDSNYALTFRNNLVRYGGLVIYYGSQQYDTQHPTWTLKDNLLDGPSLQLTTVSYGNYYVSASNNGYTAATATLGGSGNKTSLVTDYVVSGDQKFLYPASGATNSLATLLNAGSTTAGAVGLYHHTTLVSGAKETNGVVDIGFHYPSPPVDSDGDDLSDCLEDKDGDGVTDATETSFSAYDTDGDGANDSEEPAGQVASFGLTSGAPDTTANVSTGTSYVIVAAGTSHNLAVREGGQVVAWGSNTYGQTNVPAAATNAVAVAGGERHSLALTETGVVLAWGDNSQGQTNLPSSNTNFTALAAGYRHSLALKNDGTVKAWGDNTGGQTNVPASATNVIQLAGGQYHSLALKADGSVVAWGTNSLAQTNVPSTATNIVEIAAGWTHSLALRADGQVIAWGDNTGGATNVPTGLTNALHVAAGQNFSVALRNDGTLLAWGSNTSGQTNVPASLTNVQALAAGQARVLTLPYSPFLSYPVDVRRDLLVIYNSNFTESVQMKDYYLAHRPHIAGVNVLGVGLYTNSWEVFGSTDYTNSFWTTVSNWYAVNPTKRPAYVLLMYGIPNRADYYLYSGYPYSTRDSVQYLLRNTAPGRKPFLTALNFASTNDVKGYIDKLATFGTNLPVNRVVISPSNNSYGASVYAIDNNRSSGVGIRATDNTFYKAYLSLPMLGIQATNILYADNLTTPTYLATATNVTAYSTWGVNGYFYPTNNMWAVDGKVVFSSNSDWYPMTTYESYNGQWNPPNDWPISPHQQTYLNWFKTNAFGGTNYSNTPVGGTSTVDEPAIPGKPRIDRYFTLWFRGKTFALIAWIADGTSSKNQASGDPLVSK